MLTIDIKTTALSSMFHHLCRPEVLFLNLNARNRKPSLSQKSVHSVSLLYSCTKKSRSNHYERRVQHLKESFPPEWWKETKKVSCVTNFSGAKDTVLKAAHQLDCVSDLSPTKIIGLHGRLNFRRPEVWFRRPHLEFLSPPIFDLNL